ncbi:hypothetical protein BU26DRAFT_500890 [Trematosphaeria pertusa]|uniref:Secreted protein n=1 Tax=Trematosphaeria pertusa TaxID=390896 RepID=A0A6A6J0C2_9PLEO|nr:uncharacterized protein BU26DRAFT_500890 [Trematosphaeria pertusa]KAF2255300.1 hypothetical protein BU26DRAFT_500890 [Trematosphaeria pertusa]
MPVSFFFPLSCFLLSSGLYHFWASLSARPPPHSPLVELTVWAMARALLRVGASLGQVATPSGSGPSRQTSVHSMDGFGRKFTCDGTAYQGGIPFQARECMPPSVSPV